MTYMTIKLSLPIEICKSLNKWR